MNVIENLGKIGGLSISVLYLVFFSNHQWFEWSVFIFIMVTIGIPHGAIDHLVLNVRTSKTRLFIFLAKYLGILMVYMFCWFWIPIPSLIFFLLISAYHFGQGHYIKFPIKRFRVLTYFFTGGFLLSVILGSDFQMVSGILKSLIVLDPLSQYPLYFICFFGLMTMVLSGAQRFPIWSLFVLELLILAGMLFLLPLMLSFIIYFGFWHALPTMIVEYRAITLNIKKDRLKIFIHKLLPLSLISILGITGLLLLSVQRLNPDQSIFLFFILISVISAPHIWTMEQFLEKESH